MRGFFLLGLLAASMMQAVLGQSLHPRLLDPGITTDLPRVVANDNRTPAGTMNGDVLQVNLVVTWADWRIETPEGPGLRVAAIGELGDAPTIPGPLIRVEAGTKIQVTVRNALTDSSIAVFGLQSRPADARDSLVVAPGTEETATFDSGKPGSYFYFVRLGSGVDPEFDEREQLAGAFIVDPKGGSPPDRVFVINVFSTPIDTNLRPVEWLEALTINGLSWPYTERQRPVVGDTLRWRVINASGRNHPMHLHGFFYDVTSRGSPHRGDRVHVPSNHNGDGVGADATGQLALPLPPVLPRRSGYSATDGSRRR